MTRFGTVALVGSPNAGKSTLLNTLLGAKLSIVCHKRQTTRTRIAGILTDGSAQLILIDTPGIFFDAKTRLEKYMVAQAWQALFEADQVVFLADASHTKYQKDMNKIVGRLKEQNKDALLVLNKIDKVPNKANLLETSQWFMSQGIFKKAFMISAKKGQGTRDLVAYLAQHVPEGPWHYPEDQLATISERLLAAELTREVLLHELHEEIPYGLALQTDLWEPFDNGSLKIVQTIFVEKDSHKPIVLGKNGSKIKAIGMKARREIADALGCPVHLMLHVKVDEKWQDKAEFYHNGDLNLPV